MNIFTYGPIFYLKVSHFINKNTNIHLVQQYGNIIVRLSFAFFEQMCCMTTAIN